MPSLTEELEIIKAESAAINAEMEKIRKAAKEKTGSANDKAPGEVEKMVQLEAAVTALGKKQEELVKLHGDKPKKTDFDATGSIDNDTGFNTLEKRLTMPVAEQWDLTDEQIESVRKMQRINDAMYIMAAARKIPANQLSIYKSAVSKIDSLAKAFNITTSTQGGNFLPTMLSGEYLTDVRNAMQFVAELRNWPMPANTFTLPVISAGLTMYLQPEAVDDSASKIQGSTATTANAVLTAKKLAIRTLLSTEFAEDSIVQFGQIISQELARAHAYGLEDAIINGDTAGTHQDTDVTSSFDRRKAFLGLRAAAHDGSLAAAFTGAPVEGDVHAALAVMSNWANPADLRMLASWKGITLMRRYFTNFMTVDKIGNDASILSGKLERFFGIKIIGSDAYRNNLAATGLYDGATTDNTSVTLVNVKGLNLGTRRDVTVKMAEDIETDQKVAVLSSRHALTWTFTPSTTYPSVYHIYDLD